MAVSGTFTGESYQETAHAGLLEALQRDDRQHTRWMFFWLDFFILFTLILVLAYMMVSDNALKHALLIGFIGTGLGIIGVFISAITGPVGKRPPSPAFLDIFEMEVRDFLSEHDADDVSGSELVRARAYELIRGRAAQEREARLLVNRLLSISVVTILSLVLWLVFHEPVFAAVNMVFGLIITQTQYYTMPRAAMRFVESIGE